MGILRFEDYVATIGVGVVDEGVADAVARMWGAAVAAVKSALKKSGSALAKSATGDVKDSMEKISDRYGESAGSFAKFYADYKAGDEDAKRVVEWLYGRKDDAVVSGILSGVRDEDGKNEERNWYKSKESPTKAGGSKTDLNPVYPLIIVLVAFVLSLFFNDPSLNVH